MIRFVLPLALVLALPVAAQQAPAPAPVEKPELVQAYLHDITALTEGLQRSRQR